MIPLYTLLFGFVFYRIAFRLAYEENLSFVAGFIIVCLLFAVCVYLNLQSKFILLNKFKEDDPYSYDRSTIKGISFNHLWLSAIIPLIIFKSLALFIIFGFSDNLWEYDILSNGNFIITLSILSTPVILATFLFQLGAKRRHRSLLD